MSERRRDWGGALAVGPWWLLHTGDYGPTERHAHHAVQVISAAAEVTVGFGADETVAARTITVPSDLAHEIRSSGVATMMFVDGDSRTGRRLTATCTGSPVGLDATISDPGAPASQIVDRILAVVDDPAATTDAAQVSAAMSAILADLADDPDAGSVTEFAARSDLSPGRFSRRFSDEIGIPLRSYRRWLRMLHAVDALSAGASLTTAAHDAGFTDSAHLTHTFRDCFGIAPTKLLAGSRFEPPT